MNVAELKDRIFKFTNHIYHDQFHMLGLLNESLQSLTDGAKLEGEAVISTVAEQSEYSLPAGFKTPISLVQGEISNPNIVYPLVDISENKFGYSIYGDRFIIKPQPNDALSLKMYFYKMVTPLADDADIPEIDVQYHDLLPTYAAGMILLLPGMDVNNRGLADRYLNRWEEGKKSFLQSMARNKKQLSVREKITW